MEKETKKISPSQIRKETRSKIERMQTEETAQVTKNANVHEPNKVSELDKAENVKFKQCDLTFKSEKGLKTHMGKTHEKETLISTPEKERGSATFEEPSLTLTPVEGPRDKDFITVALESSEEALRILKQDEEQDLEVACLMQITEYKIMVKHLARYRFSENECFCKICDPRYWEKIRMKTK